jgi:hypothetical protein
VAAADEDEPLGDRAGPQPRQIGEQLRRRELDEGVALGQAPRQLRGERAEVDPVRRLPQLADREATAQEAVGSPAQEQVAAVAGVRIALTRYNLGISRGYQSFAKAADQSAALSRTITEAAIPDLAEFQPSPGARPDESRFGARIAVEEQAKAGANPRTIDSRSDQAVDVAGSYRLTRNLDVTAGVRYSQERDRLAPLEEPTQQDSQAVYVGTQFRF